MPLCVASTTTARPARNSAVRHHGQGRAGWRRPTRQAPHRYPAAATVTATVTTGANCHWVSTACQPNAGSMQRAYLAAVRGTRRGAAPEDDPAKGDLATARAIARFTGMGFDVSIPLTESAAYDLVVDD